MIDPLDLVVPPGATALARVGRPAADRHARSRHGALSRRRRASARLAAAQADVRGRDGARRSRARKPQDCWIATGRAAGVALDRRAVRSRAGRIRSCSRSCAIRRGRSMRCIARAARRRSICRAIDGTTWTPIAEGRARRRRAMRPRSASRGSRRAGRCGSGCAIAMARSGARTASRSSSRRPARSRITAPRRRPTRQTKMLPIPVGVVDADVRGDTAWFATNEGVARLAGRAGRSCGPRPMACAASSRAR